MVVFVALPTFMILLTIVSVPMRVLPGPPSVRHVWSFDVGAPPPSSSAELILRIATQVTTASPDRRRHSVLALATLANECPAWASQTIPHIVDALDDPEGSVRRAAVTSLAALGPIATEAVPALQAARGSHDVHYEHLLTEALWWIQHGYGWVPSGDCEHLPGWANVGDSSESPTE